MSGWIVWKNMCRSIRKLWFFESPDFGETVQRLLLPLRSSNGSIGAIDIHTSSQTIDRYDIEHWLPIADAIAMSLMKIEDGSK